MCIGYFIDERQLIELERLIEEATKDNSLYTASNWELHILEVFLVFCIGALICIMFK